MAINSPTQTGSNWTQMSPEGILQGFYLTLENWDSQIQNLRRQIQSAIRQIHTTGTATPVTSPRRTSSSRRRSTARRRPAVQAQQAHQPQTKGKVKTAAAGASAA